MVDVYLLNQCILSTYKTSLLPLNVGENYFIFIDSVSDYVSSIHAYGELFSTRSYTLHD